MQNKKLIWLVAMMAAAVVNQTETHAAVRSEERRVGKECVP